MAVESLERQPIHLCVIHVWRQLARQSLRKYQIFMLWAKTLLTFTQGFKVLAKQTCFVSSFPFHLYHNKHATY